MTTNLRLSCYASLVSLVLPMATPAQQTNPATADDPFAVLAAKEAQEPSAGGMRVVVQKPDGSPAPDAVVVFTPWRYDEAARAEREAAKQRFPVDEPLRFALLAANGTRYRVDERGASRVPKQGYVFAFVGDVAAHHYVSDDSTEPRLVLKLATPHTMTVDVVTADGKPAAAVPFAVLDTPRHSSDPGHTTGDDGTATLRLLRSRPETAIVRLEVATKTSVKAPLPREGGRVRLQLPTTTTVTATFAGDLVPGAELDWQLQCGELATEVTGERTGERTARWRYVEADAAFTITGSSGGLDLATASGTATANATPVALVRQPKVTTFAMQVLDPDGKPACNREVEPHWTSQRGSANTWGARTNREGWIELAAPPHLGARGELQLRLLLVPNARGPMEGFARLTVDAAAVGRTVLPPVRCERPPVLAAGTLTTPDGKPVPNFLIGVYTPTFQRVTTDAEGRFAIRGIELGQPIRLHLDSEWCFAKGAPWSPELAENSKDLRLVVQRAGRVRFAADLPADLHTRIRYRLEPASGEGDRVELQSLTPNELHVPPGHWHFVAHHDGKELLRLENLRAESGVETHDPRFMAFDWRAYAIAVKVTVRDSKGEPCDQCTVWVRNGGSGSGRSPTNGVLHLLLPKDGGRVDIEPRDQKIAKVDLGVVTEDQVVVLGGGTPLSVTLSPMPKLPEGVELLLVLDGGESVPFDASGSAVIVMPGAGPCAPKISVRKGELTVGPIPWSLPRCHVPKEGKKLAVDVTAERQRELDGLLAMLRR
jgi:hypothetical protein